MIQPPPLNLPPVELRTRVVDDILKVFDPLRGKYVALSPEEFVRQHFTHWLTSDLNYPASLMANEVAISLNNMRRRCDTVVYRNDGSHLMIVEYKAPTVHISQQVFDQIVRYNMVLKSRFLVVSNGLVHYCCELDYAGDSYRFLPEIPCWDRNL